MKQRQVRFLSKPPPPDFAENWYEIATDDHFWMQWRLISFFRQLNDLGLPFQASLRGLDIGCGAGVTCRQIERESCWTVDGADLMESALAMHEVMRGQSLLYDIHDRNAEFREVYDFVVLFDVIEHIQDVNRFIDSALYHLKPGGWLFINVPANQRLFSAYDRAAGHVRRYDKRSLAAELLSHRLQIQDMRYWGASLIALLLLRNLRFSRKNSPDEIIRKGFKPPHPLVHHLLKVMMRTETGLLSRPPIGSSLLAAALKV